MMAMRSVLSRVVLTRALLTRSMESSRGATRYYSEGKGKVLSEEERAAENVYIKVPKITLSVRNDFHTGSYKPHRICT